MKKHFAILPFLIVILCFSQKLLAADYYVCDCAAGSEPSCIAGNDVNNGTSASTPWRSISNVIAIVNNLQGGDRILFAKGGAWSDVSLGNIFNLNASASNPIVFDSYEPLWLGTAKPILVEARTGLDIFRFTDGGNADHDEGYVIQNLDLRGNGTGQWGVFAYNDADHITLNNVDFSGFEIGIHSAGANTPNFGADQQNQHMTLSNCTIMNCSAQGFLGGGDGLIIENSYFENNGFDLAVFNHNVYISHGDNVIVRNNELYRATIVNGLADGVSLVIHGHHDNLLIENNYIHEDPGQVTGNAWGIAVDPGYNTAEYFTNLVIRNNLIVNMYNVGIGVASSPGAIIENNIIINESAAGIVAIAAPDRVRGVEDTPMSEVTVRNNTVYLRGTDVLTTGIAVGGEGTGHVVVSNLVSMGNGNGFQMDLADSDYSSVDYNLMDSQIGAMWGAGSSLANWRLSRGFDLNSLVADPMFTSPSSPNFNLLPMAGSPVIESGHPTLSSITDYTGVNRVGMSDVGAFEVQIQPTAVNETTDVPQVFVYPNPVKDELNVYLPEGIIGVSLYHSSGKLVYQKEPTTAVVTTIETMNMQRGIYLLVLNSKESVSSTRVVLN